MGINQFFISVVKIPETVKDKRSIPLLDAQADNKSNTVQAVVRACWLQRLMAVSTGGHEE